MSYLPHLERVLSLYSEGDGLAVVMDARAAFTELSGRFDEGDPWHETWSRLFLDWFGFDYEIPPHSSPVHRFVTERYADLVAEGSLMLYRGLMSTHRSVFEVRRVGRGTIHLRDLVGGGRFAVTHPFSEADLRKGDVLDARIVPMRGELTLGAGMILHPEEAVPLIHDLVLKLADDGRLGWKTVHLLARMHLQHLQAPSLKITSIYTSKSFLVRSYV